MSEERQPSPSITASIPVIKTHPGPADTVIAPFRRTNGVAAHVGGVRRFPKGSRRTPSAAKEIHVIVDSLSAHKTKRAEQFLDENPCELHFMSSYSS